jgi:hypothetical protein
MAQTTNSGRDFRIVNFSIPTTGGEIVLNDKYANSYVIQCRTAVDIQLRRSGGASEYFTIKSGTALTLDCAAPTNEVFHATSTSGTVVIEVIYHLP